MVTIEYSKASFKKLMEKTGYPIASIEKAIRLLDILNYISKNEFLSQNLALKGGTAINMVYYQDIPRLSVDLDFDLAENSSKEKMLVIKNEIAQQLKTLAFELKYTIQEHGHGYILYQSDLYYQNSVGNRDKIKIDINCLQRCHIYETEIKELRNPLTEKTQTTRILSVYELFGAKLKALLERHTPRDIFDTYIMSKNKLFQDKNSSNSIRKTLAYYISISREINLNSSLQAIKNKPIREFKLHLFPMLKTGYGFVDRDEITSQAVTYVSQFLDFKDNELLYLRNAQNGEYHPHLLFQDGTEKRIKENPAAKFYITNGR